MRWLLMASVVLTGLGFGSLYVLADNTEDTFAWTIQPPLTAAFLGAGYGAGLLLVLLALRDGVWARARVPVYTILLFIVLTLVPTLIHLDRFHFSAEFDGLGPLAKGAAWFWLAIYVGLPLAMVPVLYLQERAAGEDPPCRCPMPMGLRLALAAESALLLAVGALMFVIPSTAESLWPWQLTPLTARVVAAWLLAFGLTAGLAAFGDQERLRTGAIAYAGLGVLVLGAVLRFIDTIEWADPAAWVFLGATLAIIATGAVGWWTAPRPQGSPRG
jgi:hypothetical protein